MVLGLAITLFVSGLLLSIRSEGGSYLRHLVPKGRPLPLAPMLVLIESVSLLIRPFTLALRIIANLAVGHVVTILAGLLVFKYGTHLRVLLIIFYLFECMVALIQAYIFSMLI